MDKRKSKIILGVLCTVVIVFAAIEMVWNWRMVKEIFNIPRAHATEQVAVEFAVFESVQDKLVPNELWEADDYVDFATWAVDLRELKEQCVGITESAVNELGECLDDETIAELQSIEDEIQSLTSITKINELLEEFNGIVEENRPLPEPEPYPTPSYSEQIVYEEQAFTGSTYDFMVAGVIYANGWRYTWYSQKVLPGGGLNIPGRHVGAGNLIYDGDGYIVVAANPSSLAYGSLVPTPFGTGKVYDCGCAVGTIDIYTNF